MQFAVMFPCFCVNPRLNYWLHSLPLPQGAYMVEKNDRIALKPVEGSVKGFGLQSSSTWRRQMERQVSLPERVGGLGLSHGLTIYCHMQWWLHGRMQDRHSFLLEITPLYISDEAFDESRQTMAGVRPAN